jgi:rod shape-determining protein MreC
MFRSHKLIAAAMLLVCLVAVAALPSSISEKIQMSVSRLYSPALKLTVAASEFAERTRNRFKSRDELQKENDELRAELARLRLEGARVEEIARENERLRQMLQFRNAARQPCLAARVIGRDTSNWWKSVRIDRGARDGVSVNAAVITPQGLVGKIIQVGHAESQVLLVTDRSCKVSARLQTSREPGIVTGGVAELSANPRCKMTFISKQAKIEPRTPVITSGMGGVFPAGYVIGTVAEKNRVDEAGLYQEIEIIPAVNFKTLEEVFVILPAPTLRQ